MNSFYFIDKPIWISSFDVIRNLRKKLNTRKIGHTWTLDPLATWGLILAVWNYTKLIPYLEKDTKEYEFEVMLDWVTASYDLAEEIISISKAEQEKCKKDLTLEKIQSVLQGNFIWEIEQIPPKYSALKISWKKAYDLAREGKDFEIKSRKITVFELELLDFDYPKLSLRAKVSAWTYIRSIAHDLWALLWCGWYVSKLRRTKIWILNIKDAQSLENLDENKVLDIRNLFANNNFIELDKNILDKLNNWLKVKWNFDYEAWKDLFVFNNDIITNIVKYDSEGLVPKKRI